MKNFQPDGQYCDLLINFKAVSIKVHKVIVCEKSPILAAMASHRGGTSASPEWPPIHTITLDLPDVTESSFLDAIRYIYNEKRNEDILPLIKALICLECDKKDVLKLTRKSLKGSDKLSQSQVDLLLYIFELYPQSPFLNFYGHELDCTPNSDISELGPFFGLKYEELLIQKYNNRRRFPPYVEAKEKKWFHFYSFPSNDSHKIEAFGVDWLIDRFLYSFGYGDDVDLIKIYVDDAFISPPGETKLNIRANFIIYSLEREPKIEILRGENINPEEYKSTHMKSHRIPNHLGFDLYKYNEKMLRVSLLMELL